MRYYQYNNIVLIGEILHNEWNIKLQNIWKQGSNALSKGVGGKCFYDTVIGYEDED